MTPYVIVAEDDAAFRALLSAALERAGFRVVECAHGMELVCELERVLDGDASQGCSCVVSDIRMPGVMGISVLEGLHAVGAALPVFLMTAFGSDSVHARARELGARRVFDKPFNIEDLVTAVRQSLEPA